MDKILETLTAWKEAIIVLCLIGAVGWSAFFYWAGNTYHSARAGTLLEATVVQRKAGQKDLFSKVEAIEQSQEKNDGSS